MVATVKFSERNEQILQLYEGGLTLGKIADQMGVTRNVVAGVVHRAGVADRGGWKFPHQSLVGNRYGRLTVLQEGEFTRHGNRRYLCKCDCGKRRLIQANSLQNGASESCGCLRLERISAALTKYRKNDAVTKHAIKLRGMGWSYKAIGQALEIPESTAWRLVDKFSEMESA